MIGRALEVGVRLALIGGLIAACSARVTTSPGLEPSPTESSAAPSTTPASGGPTEVPGNDEATALAIATAFETARAAGDWEDARALLSDDARTALESIDGFARVQGVFNSVGGSRFVMQAPTQDPDLLESALGPDAVTIDFVADMSRGYLVRILHPDVTSASLGTTAVFAAPLDTGGWRIWPVR